MTEPTHAELFAEIAALRGTTETELKNLNLRLSGVEKTQLELVRLATSGKASLRTLLWIGGLVTAGVTALAAAWSIFTAN